MRLRSLLRGRLLVLALVRVAVLAGATAVAAAPAGKHKNHCPGIATAQRLASDFSLSTASTSDDVQAICSLHRGTFTDTTPAGVPIASHHVFGYGEIRDLLTYAQYLATHDSTNTGGTLTSNNLRSYLAEALQRCGSTRLKKCLKTQIPGFQPGKHGGKGKGH